MPKARTAPATRKEIREELHEVMGYLNEGVGHPDSLYGAQQALNWVLKRGRWQKPSKAFGPPDRRTKTA